MPGQRQLPRHCQRQRAAADDQRQTPRLAEARRDRAEQPPARHKYAERVRSDKPASRLAGERRRRQCVVHRHIFGHRHDRRDARLRAFGNRITHAFGRRVDQGDIRPLRKVGDAVVERQAVHRRAAAAERDAADERRAGLDHAGNLVARVAAGRRNDGNAPWLRGEKRQARWTRHAISSGGDAPAGAKRAYYASCRVRRKSLVAPPRDRRTAKRIASSRPRLSR